MIEGFSATLIQGLPDHLSEVRLTQIEGYDGESPATLTVILAVGPADPNALSYLLPRTVFERGSPVHVGALGEQPDDDMLNSIYDVLEVMDADDIAVFLCEQENVRARARQLLLE